MTESEVIALVNTEIQKAGGVRALARQWCVSAAHLCHLRQGCAVPGPKILVHLGLERVKVVTYEPKQKRRIKP